MRLEVRKLGWGGSQKYITLSTSLPKSMLSGWTKDGNMPSHVQLSQTEPGGAITVTPVTWPQDKDYRDPLNLLSTERDEDLPPEVE